MADTSKHFRRRNGRHEHRLSTTQARVFHCLLHSVRFVRSSSLWLHNYVGQIFKGIFRGSTRNYKWALNLNSKSSYCKCRNFFFFFFLNRTHLCIKCTSAKAEASQAMRTHSQSRRWHWESLLRRTTSSSSSHTKVSSVALRALKISFFFEIPVFLELVIVVPMAVMPHSFDIHLLCSSTDGLQILPPSFQTRSSWAVSLRAAPEHYP